LPIWLGNADSAEFFADAGASYSEDALLWPKVRRDGLLPVDGLDETLPVKFDLEFGDPNDLTRKENI
jgi:hypothetical protein